MSASNTRDCFREFVGQRLVGLLFDAMPAHRRDLRAGNHHLIFEDGRALTIAPNGSYWIESADDVARAIQAKKNELEQVSAEIREVISAAGADS